MEVEEDKILTCRAKSGIIRHEGVRGEVCAHLASRGSKPGYTGSFFFKASVTSFSVRSTVLQIPTSASTQSEERSRITWTPVRRSLPCWTSDKGTGHCDRLRGQDEYLGRVDQWRRLRSIRAIDSFPGSPRSRDRGPQQDAKVKG